MSETDELAKGSEMMVTVFCSIGPFILYVLLVCSYPIYHKLCKSYRNVILTNAMTMTLLHSEFCLRKTLK